VLETVDVVGLGLNAMDTICVVESFPKPQSKVRIKHTYAEPGGQVATALVTCSRFGLKTRYMGCVGADDAGRDQIASLRAENVDVEFVRTVEGAGTQWASIILVEGVGERTILWQRDPKLEYPADAVSQEAIESARLLHVDGCDMEASIKAARIARSAGLPVVADIDEVYGPLTEDLLKRTDYVIVPEEFAVQFTGEEKPEEAARAITSRCRCPIVGITLGSRGAVFSDHGEIKSSPAFNVPVSDTTGAGDVFHGAFIYGILREWPLEHTIRFAHAAAALKCTQVGARRGIPTLDQLAAFLNQK
jgi:sulfofructose kinase